MHTQHRLLPLVTVLTYVCTCQSHTCIAAGAVSQNDSSFVLLKIPVLFMKLATAQDSSLLARQQPSIMYVWPSLSSPTMFARGGFSA